MRYRERVVDRVIGNQLASAGAVLIEGPKACGKTVSASRHAASRVLLDVDELARTSLDVDPSLVLDGPRPRLLDEWQVEPRLWNYVRRAVDASDEAGQFLLTGSATPEDDARRHSGAGRFASVRMRPMSLFESGHSTGDVSLSALLRGEEPRATGAGLGIHELVDRIVVGGWPRTIDAGVEEARRSAVNYLDNVRHVDINRVDATSRDPVGVARLLASLARNVATEAKFTVLAKDTGDDGPHEQTVASYVAALERLMVIEDQPAWRAHLRSSATLRKAAKRHLADPSLAVAALRAGPERLLADLEYTGLLFESLVVRDLRVLTQPLDAEIAHYRDSYGVEVDVIVDLPGGGWGAFEVKLGAGMIDAGAASLLRFREQLDTTRTPPPTVTGVIVGTADLAYRRPDGIDVLPIASLAP